MADVENRFHRPPRRVSIADMGATHEDLCLRMICESLGASVRMHFIGAPQDVLAVIWQPEDPPSVLIMCGHGTETGFVLGPYADHVDTSFLVDGCLPASSLWGRIALTGTTVFSTACVTGARAFADAFRDGNVRAYAAPCGYPSGAEVLFFLHAALFGILARGDDPVTALHAARSSSHDPEAYVVALG